MRTTISKARFYKYRYIIFKSGSKLIFTHYITQVNNTEVQNVVGEENHVWVFKKIQKISRTFATNQILGICFQKGSITSICCAVLSVTKSGNYVTTIFVNPNIDACLLAKENSGQLFIIICMNLGSAIIHKLLSSYFLNVLNLHLLQEHSA